MLDGVSRANFQNRRIETYKDKRRFKITNKIHKRKQRVNNALCFLLF